MEESSIGGASRIGLASGIVVLEPYFPGWPRVFEQEKARLEASLGELALDIQHVGSTAIPGLAAKPIIDIAIAVRDWEEASVSVRPMELLGYEYKGELGIARRHYFTKGSPRTHHIHMVERDSESLLTYILFRDYLIEHREARERYAALKAQLAERFPNHRELYTEGKASFIQGAIQEAKREAGRNRPQDPFRSASPL